MLIGKYSMLNDEGVEPSKVCGKTFRWNGKSMWIEYYAAEYCNARIGLASDVY